jgi:uncharacterized protein YbcI
VVADGPPRVSCGDPKIVQGGVRPPGSEGVAMTRASKTAHGDVLTAISDGIVGLLKEFYGRGPTQVKSYYTDDLVVCLLRGGFTRVEETLLRGGRGEAVIDQRMAFQEIMRHRFEQVIADATGRTVVGFMSGNQQEPDMMCEVFVLGSTDPLSTSGPDEDDVVHPSA